MTDVAHVLARESLAMQPLPQNVSRARRTVVETLLSTDRGDLADAAALVTSEIVTNAVLHTGSDIWLTITVTSAGVLVEVEDHSSQLPTPRSYDAIATTGRGMALIDELVSEFGVRALQDDGKVVWFTLGAARSGVETAALALRPSAPVRLLHVPVALYCAFQQVADGLLREYVLVHFDRRFGGTDLDECNRANAAFAELAFGGAAAFAARDGGASYVDVTFTVGAAAAARFTSLRRVLGRAVAMATGGLMLAPPSQPEIVAMRNWCCEQVLLQLAGTAATPWLAGGKLDVPPPMPPAL